MEIEKLERVPLFLYHDLVRVTKSGNILDVTYTEHRNTSQNVQMLPDGKMLILSTGEIIDVEHGSARLDYKNNLFRTFRRIRNLVNSNVTDSKYCRWVTLTYAENMQDAKKLMRDFDSFRKRLNRFFQKNNIPLPEYISVPEPQERGAWHLHIIYIWQGVYAPYIDNTILRKIWGHGFVSVKSLADVDNIGAYLCAYLGDIETDSDKGIEKEILAEDGTKIKKRIIKGGRLKYYPSNFNMIRHSQGVKVPEIFDCKFEQIKEKVSSAKETYSSAVRLSDGDFNTIIVHRQYNLKPRENQ